MYENQFYPQYAPMDQLQQLRAQQAPMTGFAWVQGEEAARAYMVAPGHKMMLLDAEANVFYFKSTDPSGMPLPFRIFDFTERQPAQRPEPTPAREYVEKGEFEDFKAELKKALEALVRKETANG